MHIVLKNILKSTVWTCVCLAFAFISRVKCLELKLSAHYRIPSDSRVKMECCKSSASFTETGDQGSPQERDSLEHVF